MLVFVSLMLSMACTGRLSEMNQKVWFKGWPGRLNKRGVRAALALLLVVLLTGSLGIWHSFTGGSLIDHGFPDSETLNQYEIHVVFDPVLKTLVCSQKVLFRNQTGKTLSHLYFHLYPNAFQYEERPAFPPSEMAQAYPNGFSPGSLTLERVLVDGKAAAYVTAGYSEDILLVLLKEPLAPGEAAVVALEYTVVLPNALGRFGYGDYTYKGANWYPILSVYDHQGWNLNRHYPIGDPFYSEVSDYIVTLQAPSGFIIASTGDLVSETDTEDGIVREIHARAVRDFAFVASEHFKVASAQVGHTTVHSYYFSEPYGLLALDYAVQALAIYNDLFGLYPYNQFSVVETDFFIGGMEYPNLIMVDTRLYNEADLTWLEIVTVHETAHQWWYGLIGNNQVEAAWLDEGLTEYSTVLYYGVRYGPEEEREMFETYLGAGKYRMMEGYIEALGLNKTIHRPTYAFPDWVSYDVLVYGKGAMLFDAIRQVTGDDLFVSFLQTYFKVFRYKNAAKADLIKILNEVTEQEWTEFMEEWLFDHKKE